MSNIQSQVVVNQDTGEAFTQTIIEQERKGKKPARSEGFAQMWVNEFLRVLGKAPGGVTQTFLLLAAEMDPKTGVVYLDLPRLNKTLGYAFTTQVSANIGQLVKAGALQRAGHGRVIVNPNIAWRGPRGDRTLARWRWQNGNPVSASPEE